MLNQTLLMDQLLKVLVNLPTNSEFVQLLESVKEQSAAHTSGLDALFHVMTAVQQLLDSGHRVTDPSAPTPLYSDKGQQSPRARSRTPERMREDDHKIDHHVSVLDSQSDVVAAGIDPSQCEEALVLSDTLKTEEDLAAAQELSPCEPPVQCEGPVIIDQPRAIRPPRSDMRIGSRMQLEHMLSVLDCWFSMCVPFLGRRMQYSLSHFTSSLCQRLEAPTQVFDL